MLFLGADLGKGFAELRKVEQRIVAKAARAVIFTQEDAAGFTAHDKLATVRKNASNGTNVCPTAFLIGDIAQIVKQALDRKSVV